jgi:uncharacterized protein DUF222
MFGDIEADVATSVVARLSAVVDELQSLDLTCLPGDDVLGVLRDLEVQKRRLATVDHALIAETDSRGLAHERACRSTAALLTQLVRVSPSEATARVRAAADLGPRRGLTGQALPPVFAQVAAAQAAGTISTAHARVVTATIDALPAAVQVEHEEWVQAFLVEQAAELDPALLKQVARRITDTLDPDGTLTEERDRARRRDLTVRQRRDGSAHLEAELTAICAEALLSVLDSVAKPAPAEDGAHCAHDPRTPGQRSHDGLQDALLALLRSGELPACNGVAATIVLTMTEQQAETRTGLVTTGHGALISVEQALTLAGDARLMPVVLTRTRGITAYGDSHRIFTEGQRLAMIARDQGCSFPGCSVGPAWCQAHHITDFAVSKRTSVDDGTLLCGYHHREHPNLDWTCQMINGTPHWTPPHWIDPTQTPRRNRTHDLLGV